MTLKHISSLLAALLIVCVQVCAQNGASRAKFAKPQAAAPKTVRPFIADGNSFTLNLDHRGTSFGVTYADQGFGSPPSGNYTWVTVFGEFKTAQGCNSWFGKSATFILDDSLTINLPSPAQCPLPPVSPLLPIWTLERISIAHVAKLQLDGALFDLSPVQLSALKAFVELRLPPSAWRKEHEPYALSASSVDASSTLADLVGRSSPWNAYGTDEFKYIGSLTADRQGVSMDLFRFTTAGSNHINHHETDVFGWSDLQLSTSAVRCDACVKKTVISSVNGEDFPPKASMESLYSTPYSPGPATRKTWEDFQRGIAYLWYQNMYLHSSN
jgi:hypothetical protein